MCKKRHVLASLIVLIFLATSVFGSNIIGTMFLGQDLVLTASAGSNYLNVERTIEQNDPKVGDKGTIDYVFSSPEFFAKDTYIERYIEERPVEIVIVVDTSLSMSGNRILEARNAAKGFIDSFAGYPAKIGIVEYGTRGSVISELRSVENSQDNVDGLKSDIDGLSVSGYTNTGDGYRLAYHMLRDSESDANKSIVLMSDGGANKYRERNGNYYTGKEMIGYVRPILGFDTHKGDAYAKTFARLSKDEGFSNYIIGFRLNTNLSKRLEDIADEAEGGFYDAQDGDALDSVYTQIADAIEEESIEEKDLHLSYKDIYIEDKLPVGVKPIKTELPAEFEKVKNDDGSYTIKGTISEFKLDNTKDNYFKLLPITESIEVEYVTGGEKEFSSPVEFTFKNHEGGQDTGKFKNNPSILVRSDLVSISRQILGSELYELDILGDDKDGFEEEQNIKNKEFAAKGEKGSIDYEIKPKHKVTASGDVDSFGVDIKETLPAGVKAIESELPSGLTQSSSDNVYVVSGTIEVELEKVNGYGNNTYKIAAQKFIIPVKFNSMGTKSVNSLEVRYEHIVEGEKSENVDGTDSVKVFQVSIEKGVEIINDDDNDGKSRVKFTPEFEGINDEDIDLQKLTVNGTESSDFKYEDGRLEILNLDLEIYELIVKGTVNDEKVGFKVRVPVYNFEAADIEAFKGDHVSQKIDLEGAIVPEIDWNDNGKVTNITFAALDYKDLSAKNVDDDELNLEYELKQSITPKGERDLRVSYTPLNTSIRRSNTFEILSIDDMLSLAREFVGSQFYELDIIGDGVNDFESHISNKKTVAKDQPGRINYKLSSNIVVYENTDSFTATFEEELPEGVKVIVDDVTSAGITVNDDGDGYEVEIKVEFNELGEGGHRVKDKEFSIPVTFSSIGTKELSGTAISYEYIGATRTDAAGDASVDVFDVEIEKVILDDESNVIFTPNLRGVQGNISIGEIKVDRHPKDFNNESGKITMKDVGIGRRGFVVKNVEGETVGFKVDIPVFSTDPETVVGISGQAISQRITLEGPLDLKTETINDKYVQNLYIEIQIVEENEITGENEITDSITGEAIEILVGDNDEYRIRHRYEAPSKIGEDEPNIDVTYLTELKIPIIRKNIFTQVLLEETLVN